jgi:hypothetical protein
MWRILYLFISLLSFTAALAQQSKQRVFSSDIDRFWTAYDSVRTTSDSLRQVAIFTRLYLVKGTPGLRALQQVEGYTAAEWVGSIRHHPKFWNSIRPSTQLAKSGAQNLAPYLTKFQQLYPSLRPASIYFTIGALRSGGTTKDSLVLIGAELETGNPQTDISEFTGNDRAFLASVFARNPFDNIIPLNVHEYVHTQEHGPGNTVLGQALYEGTCDLVTELVTGRKVPLPYMTYGPAHEAELKERFKLELFTPNISNWFYNQLNKPGHIPDLGYYMGYAIGKRYYQQARDKKQVIKELIELDYTNDQAVEAFLTKTRYYPQPLDKAQVLAAYEQRRPVVTRFLPAPNAAGLLDASVREIRVEFSVPMDPNSHSTDYGPGGKDAFPVVKQPGFGSDKQVYTYQVALQPGHSYSFVLNGGGFQDENGYPLQQYEVKFRTRE